MKETEGGGIRQRRVHRRKKFPQRENVNNVRERVLLITLKISKQQVLGNMGKIENNEDQKGTRLGESLWELGRGRAGHAVEKWVKILIVMTHSS